MNMLSTIAVSISLGVIGVSDEMPKVIPSTLDTKLGKPYQLGVYSVFITNTLVDRVITDGSDPTSALYTRSACNIANDLVSKCSPATVLLSGTTDPVSLGSRDSYELLGTALAMIHRYRSKRSEPAEIEFAKAILSNLQTRYRSDKLPTNQKAVAYAMICSALFCETDLQKRIDALRATIRFCGDRFPGVKMIADYHLLYTLMEQIQSLQDLNSQVHVNLRTWGQLSQLMVVGLQLTVVEASLRRFFVIQRNEFLKRYAVFSKWGAYRSVARSKITAREHSASAPLQIDVALLHPSNENEMCTLDLSIPQG